MSYRILITGSSGLVGTALTLALRAVGAEIQRFDVRARGGAWGDVRDSGRLREAVAGVDGVVHLAAISRVVWAERDPESCRATNVGGLGNLLDAAASAARPPWVIFASSREVYGQPEQLPVSEDAPLRPVNVYGRSKVEGERLIEEARGEGLRACTVRFSNVYGSTDDHADRVVPAFARAAALGEELRVDGLDHTFDFTHVADVARGVVALVGRLSAGEAAPAPIHFVSGWPTTLGELARLAVRLGDARASIRVAEPRDFDVARFCGSPARAKAVLGWEAEVGLEDGLARLVHAFRRSRQTLDAREAAR